MSRSGRSAPSAWRCSRERFLLVILLRGALQARLTQCWHMFYSINMHVAIACPWDARRCTDPALPYCCSGTFPPTVQWQRPQLQPLHGSCSYLASTHSPQSSITSAANLFVHFGLVLALLPLLHPSPRGLPTCTLPQTPPHPKFPIRLRVVVPHHT